MKARGTQWTPAEDATYRALFIDGADDAAIAAALDRTVQSVSSRRPHLGLSRPRYRQLGSKVEDGTPWPVCDKSERKRGECILNRVFGGKPRVDLRPVNAMQMPHVATHVMGASSAAWAVAQ